MSAKVLGGLCLYSFVMTGSTVILAWWLGSSCGINSESEIKGDENTVENTIQRGVFNFDISSSGDSDTCEIWHSLGFKTFEWLVIVIMIIVFSYWMSKKCMGKKGYIAKWKLRRERLTIEKKEKIMIELRKQIANDEVIAVEEEAKDHIQKPKYYGLDSIPAI